MQEQPMGIPCPRRAYCMVNGCQGLCSDKRETQREVACSLVVLPSVQRASACRVPVLRNVSRARGYRGRASC